ncbi:hypothetical protein FEM48_Zijuj09G0020000 [Ziziphus jujuba var. spinosa]|uniref:RING-type E3 ubiquitin transferase n=1 Tax=Ziziphus jujuba var. spinosa TaxID=714518 RepID=A0A978UQ94_ZIZJJ|nr:hypothetical protein FEM48_Zijuj09G0020000 [Ziziphus jujuba var. spinosa]
MDSSTDIEGPVNYAVNGRIMLCSGIAIFFVVFLIVCFKSHARWFLYRRRRRIGHHRRRRPTELFSRPVFPTTTDSVSLSPHEGLDLSVIKTLPTFIYSITTTSHHRDHHPVALLECVVCLSQFEDEEQGRVLPNCKHAFHVQCIDAWFQSHSNCPLCRAPVRSDFPVHLPETSTQTIITVNEQPEVEAELRGSSESSMPEVLSSEWCRRKPMELESVAVEVPCTRVRSMDEMGLGSHEFGSHRSKSPANRIIQLKRIWSI